MKRVIIIEGPDNIGKSYFAKFLQHEISRMSSAVEPRIIHCGPPIGEGRAALTYQLQYLKRTCEDVLNGDGVEIWDRSVIGEDVYGPLFRTGQYDHHKYSDELRQQLQTIQHRLCVIVMYTDGEVYKRLGVKKKADEKKAYQQQQHASNIAMKFVDVAAALGIKRTLYVNCANYVSLDERNKYVLSRVKSWLKMIPYQHTQTNSYAHTFFNATQMLWETGVGFINQQFSCDDYDDGRCNLGQDHRAVARFGSTYNRPTGPCGALTNIRYVFVGEAPGQDGCGKTGVPFYDDRSGNLMQVTLDRLCVHPIHYYMTNTVKCCPVGNKLELYVNKKQLNELDCVHKLSNELGRVLKKNPTAKVIAIGKTAAAELKRMHMSYRTVYHPAYYLRMGISGDFYRELKVVMEA